MLKLIPYNRRKAVEYAHLWAFNRNPLYYNFNEIGGDCTNFASQVLFSGVGIMNFTPDFGWYYIDAEKRAPAWTGVQYFWDFITRDQPTVGPFGIGTTLEFLRPGDFIQIRFNNSEDQFSHTVVVVETGYPAGLDSLLVAAHSNDTDFRPLSSYKNVVEYRFLHILGAIGAENI